MKCKKVVHIITRFILGGADENTLLTCNIQAENGLEVFLFVGREHSQLMLDKLSTKVKLIVVNEMVRDISPFKDIKAFIHLCRLIREIQPDIVHTHESKAGILGRLTAPLVSSNVSFIHGVHIIPFMNTDSKLRYFLYLYLEKLAALFTDAFISVSPALERTINDAQLTKHKKSYVIYSGMDIDEFKNAQPINSEQAAKQLGPKYDLYKNAFKLVMSGTLESRKRVDLGIEAVKKLKDCGINVFLTICGDGNELRNLTNLANNLGVENQVFFAGYTTEIAQIISSADIGLHCSKHEGLPRVLIQYIASGKPIITTKLPGVEIIVNKNGYILETENLVEEIAEKISKLYYDDALLIATKIAAKTMSLEKWDQNKMVSEINKVYEGF